MKEDVINLKRNKIMKKTSVELLEKKLNEIKSSSTNMNGTIKFLETEFKELFKQAKEMEKQQIIVSHINGQAEYDSQAFSSTNKRIAEQYYNEKFNK